ncbi:hypothetical protein DFJ74DRAFT_472925 [Hyaloraphidium curvatum]|nr:hypothetical protein DFJ74DRAFT_472925 [Hyaloraphidium curvatum]
MQNADDGVTRELPHLGRGPFHRRSADGRPSVRRRGARLHRLAPPLLFVFLCRRRPAGGAGRRARGRRAVHKVPAEAALALPDVPQGRRARRARRAHAAGTGGRQRRGAPPVGLEDTPLRAGRRRRGGRDQADAEGPPGDRQNPDYAQHLRDAGRRPAQRDLLARAGRGPRAGLWSRYRHVHGRQPHRGRLPGLRLCRRRVRLPRTARRGRGVCLRPRPRAPGLDQPRPALRLRLDHPEPPPPLQPDRQRAHLPHPPPLPLCHPLGPLLPRPARPRLGQGRPLHLPLPRAHLLRLPRGLPAARRLARRRPGVAPVPVRRGLVAPHPGAAPRKAGRAVRGVPRGGAAGGLGGGGGGVHVGGYGGAGLLGSGQVLRGRLRGAHGGEGGEAAPGGRACGGQRAR